MESLSSMTGNLLNRREQAAQAVCTGGAHAATMQTLREIQTSIVRKAVLRYRALLEQLLPVGTLRRWGYRRLVTAAAGLFMGAKGREGSHAVPVQRGHHETDPVLGTEEKDLTIICASYRRYREIHVLVNSLLCQTSDNWKLLVIHDGYDETMEGALRPYCQQHPRIEFVFAEKRYNDYGHSLREIGLARAQTEFVMFTNDDNYYAPKFLEYMFEAIKHHNLDLVLCNMIHSHRNPGRYRRDDYHLFDSYPRMRYIDIGNFIVRRSIAQEVKFSDKSFSADGVFIERIMSSYNVVNLIPGWRWKLSLLRQQRWAPNRKTIRIGKVDRVLFVHN